ncbi:hypothetical protein [Xylanibacter brevis]|uniref:hypothetical protein n=1 Tax=Xylanibacter brevis TaxID=83231 RepID=UPI0012DED7CE|nr:hypothetical protein [Xylanibacter brevis]
MKKFFNYAFAGAIALIGTYVFSGCTSDDEVVTDAVNPTYDSEKGTVNTQFVLNIAAADQSGMKKAPLHRSSATATQALGTNFRGLTDARILTYKQSENGKHLYDVSTSALATSTRNYDLSNLLASGAIAADNSRRVVELALPVGTNTLLFYGRAPKPTTGANPSEYGNISYSVADNATGTEFSTHTRINGNNAAYTSTSYMLAVLMTRMANLGLHVETPDDHYLSKSNQDYRVTYWTPGYLDVPYKTVSGSLTALSGQELTDASTAGTYTDVEGGVTYTKVGPITKDWREYGLAYNDPLTRVSLKPLEEILGKAYSLMTTIRTVGGATEIRSGSAEGILSVIEDLWAVADKVSVATVTSEKELIAKKMGQRIKNRFSNYFQRDETGNVTFKDLTAVKTAFDNYIKVTPGSLDAAIDLNTFPQALNLPEGAAQMIFDPTANSNTGAFSYVSDISVFKPVSNSTTTVEKFLYPAELVYFGNSPVRVSSETHVENNYPQTVANWDKDDYWVAANNLKGWVKNGAVGNTTRSVAMQRDINYGTAMLATTVKYGASVINDNQAACTEEVSDQHISVNSTSFKLTGVIVGGQCQKVGWNFLKKDVTGNDFNFMVYDSYIGNDGNGINVPAHGTTSDFNYTLLWDNYDAANNKQPVFVALEFVNNSGVDFWGNANLIRRGSKFYLVGKLDPTSSSFPVSRATTDASNYILPPYKATDGTTDTEKVRVFMQDYKTTANFTISTSSLKSAYSTVPDLRSSQISLGLAVDIQWEPGLTFDVELGQQ